MTAKTMDRLDVAGIITGIVGLSLTMAGAMFGSETMLKVGVGLFCLLPVTLVITLAARL